MSEPQGVQFGKYRIVRKLGEGAFGAVYEAYLPGPMGFTKRVAIKMLRSYIVAEDPTFVQSMVNEARIGGLLHHGNIVDVVEFDQVGEHYYLAMEYVDGLTLAEIVRICRHNDTLLPRFATLKLAGDICRGLHYAHTLSGPDGRPLNLIHRDLKPTNVIVNAEGVAKLLDFGIAKAASNLFNTTATSVTKGTPRYMSPEQMTSKAALTHRSDIFSLGVVLFEMIAGRVLFDAPSLPGLAMLIVQGPPDPDLDEAEAALPGCRPILARAMELKVEDRYPDVQTLAADLIELGQQYPANTDMGEVIARLIPLMDTSEQAPVNATSDLKMTALPAQDGLLSDISDQQPIPPPSPESAGWDHFTSALKGDPSTGSRTATQMDVAPGDETRPVFTLPAQAAAGDETQPLMNREPAGADTLPPGARMSNTAMASPSPARPRWPLFAAIGAILAVVLVGAAVMVGRNGGDTAAPDPPPDAVAEADEPMDAQPLAEPATTAPEATTGADATADAPAEEPAEPATEPATEAPPEPSTQAPVEETVAPPPEEPATTAPTEPAQRDGTITVRSKPWAQIYVDGEMVKESVILKKHAVTGGRHTVRLVCPDQGGAEKVFSVDINGQDASLGCWDFAADAPCS